MVEIEKFSFLSSFSDDATFYFIKTTEETLMVNFIKRLIYFKKHIFLNFQVFNVLSADNFEISYRSNVKSTPSFIKISKQCPESHIYYLAIGCVDGTLLVYNLLTKKLIFSDKEANNEAIADIQFNYDSESLALMTFSQRFIKYDLRSQQV